MDFRSKTTSSHGVLQRMNKVFMICLFFMTLAASAYPLDEPALSHGINLEKITLEEALSLAISNSVEITRATLTIKDDETRLLEETVWNWLRPNVSVRGGVDTETGQPQLSIGGGVDLRDVMGAGKKRIKAIKFSISEEKRSLETIKASIKIKVTGAYQEYRSAKEKLKALETALQDDENAFRMLESTGSEVEKLLIRSIINQDKLALITARQELFRIETALRELLAITP